MAGVTDMAETPAPAIRMPRRVLHRIGPVLLATASCAVGSASENRASFTVGARVLAQASLSVTAEPADISISPEDLRRGYVEVIDPTHLEIRTNSPAGYALLILPQSSWFSAVTVRGAGAEVTIGADGGTIIERGAARHSALELTYRFALADLVAAPGRYPWPLHLDVQPLESP